MTARHFTGNNKKKALEAVFQIMTIKFLRSRLISFGYNPAEVEYTLSEVLQHKKPELLNETDIKVLITMLEERMQMERAKAKKRKQPD